MIERTNVMSEPIFAVLNPGQTHQPNLVGLSANVRYKVMVIPLDPPNTDLDVRLFYDPAGALVDKDESSASTAELLFTALADGPYVIVVSRKGGGGGPVAYKIQIDRL
jgi:hypothetical protein